MKDITKYRDELSENSYSIVDGIYSAEEVNNILAVIENADTSKDTFRKSADSVTRVKTRCIASLRGGTESPKYLKNSGNDLHKR